MREQSAVTTFLFTDIEGSTHLWEREPEQMRPALARHDALTRDAVESRRGIVVKMTGDGVHAAFTDPLDAVSAAVQVQQALAGVAPVGGAALRVRCGLHVGVVEVRDNDYFGGAVNRAARIMSAAHGGQVLLSQPVADLIGARLPADITLRDLGHVRLRDLAQPEHIFQVLHPALRDSFPALRSLEAVPNNLPQQVTTFIGRERELADVEHSLARVRLLTLVGTGGLGKTRLSLQVAAGVIDDFPEGVWFVELAAITDTRLVPQAVASTLGVTEDAGQPIVDALIAQIRDRRLLILLDNCEHLNHACASLARQLLQAGAGVKVLATSREPLHVAGETIYTLPALTFPADAKGITPETLMQSEAVRLFVDRAAAVQPAFTVTAQNAAAIATICRRVDGIPLALELAAARVRALPVATIATRLDDRFRLLTGGDRTGLPRQQTLRALIDWSHELLLADERALFRRLAVFAGGFTLDAAEAVGHGDDVAEPDVLDVLVRLVEKSLVEREAGGARYRLLETVRQFARERLDESGGTSALRDRHLRFYLSLAERARPGLVGPQQTEWLGCLDGERENLLAAHAWARESDVSGDYGLRLVSALRRYWIFRGQLGLGYQITLEALARPETQAPTRRRCDALLDAGQLGSFMGRYAEAQQYLEQCLAIARDLDDTERISAVLQPLGFALLGRGDFAAAQGHLREGLELAQQLGEPREIAGAMNGLAQTARAAGDLATAEPLYARVLAIARDTGDVDIIAVCLLNLAMVAIGRDATARAHELLVEVLHIVDDSGLKPAAQSLLEVSAGLASARGEWEDAARFFGAADAQTAETGLHRDPADEAFLAPFMTRARETLGAAAFSAGDAAGRALAYDQAIASVRAWLSRG